jgi:two-component system cell cycle sensor histidine kinase PleC
MRTLIDMAGFACLALLGAISVMHGPNEVALLLPKPGAVFIGAVVFFSCLCGMIVVHLRTNGELVDGPRLDAQGEDLERLIADRTLKLREKVVELEKARAAAVEASTAKSRFLATMSHELRTPLNAILGFSEVIEREMYGAAGDKRYPEYAHHIHESGSHLLSLIRDILDLSKIEAGKMELSCEPVGVADLIAEACRLTNAERNHALCVHLGHDLPAISADPRAAKQMLLNLLSNAMKFTPPGRSIIVTAGSRADGGVTIAVADHGIGIAKEDIPMALAAYSQVDNAQTRSHDGTGLGLPIVHALMKLHGGSLTLESEVGRGTTVSLHFPPAVTLAQAA